MTIRAQSRMNANHTIIWSLTDLRRWWMSPARLRWRRALAPQQGSRLTNFGDVI
jgi:hypothetical protein